MRCLIEELDRLDVLPWGWVMLRRTPNTAPEDGFIELHFTGNVNLIKQNNALLRVARAAKMIVDSAKWRRLMHIDDLEAAIKEMEHLL